MNMNEVFEGSNSSNLRKGALAVLVLLSLFLLAKTVSEVSGMRFIGAGTPAMNTITVEGDGEAVAIPDIAEFSFSVVEKAGTVAAAQDSATKKMNAAIEYLKSQAIDEKDIKTISYNVGPQYEWQSTGCVNGSCPGGRSVLTGYEVRQTVLVKVRDTAKAGDLLSGIGSTGATELSGLTFSVDNDDELKDSAREEAIDKAQEKADTLADQLGVRLVRIVNFSENGGGGYPTPMYAREAYGMGGDTMNQVKIAPAVPSGENKITSHVTITYEIR